MNAPMSEHAPVSAARPWYREPWPWAVIAGPAIVVVAGIITMALALRSNDGVVAEDYYRQGLAVNQVLKRERHAGELGLSATAHFAPERVRVVLGGNADLPAAIELRLVHPTRSGSDQRVVLQNVAPRIYEASFRRSDGERRLVVLEDVASSWRLAGLLARDAGSAALTADR